MAIENWNNNNIDWKMKQKQKHLLNSGAIKTSLVEALVDVENSDLSWVVPAWHGRVVEGLRWEFECRVVTVEDLVAAVDWRDLNISEGVVQGGSVQPLVVR